MAVLVAGSGGNSDGTGYHRLDENYGDLENKEADTWKNDMI